MMWTTWRWPGVQCGAIESATAIGPSKMQVVARSRAPRQLAAERLVSDSPPSTPPPGSSQYSLPGFSWRQSSTRPCQRISAETRMRAGSISDARRAEAADTPLRLRQLVDLDELDLRNGQDHELRDAHPRLDDERLGRVGVEQVHEQLAAVAGVDSPGVFTIVMPCFAARPERGWTKPAYPSGIATARPVADERALPRAELDALARRRGRGPASPA